eukprot:g6191.t1
MGLCASGKKSSSVSYKSSMSPEEVQQRKEDVIKFRQKIKRNVTKSILDTGKGDVFCSIVEEPWKMKGDTYVMDVFEFFKKRSREINIALKGGLYEEHDLTYDYNKSVVIMLVSRNSGKCVSAILLVEHDSSGGKTWEVIWFGTRERKQNKGYGCALFRATQRIAKANNVKGILVTATDEVVVWWAGCAGMTSAKSARLCPLIIRQDGSDRKWKKALPKPYDRKVKKLPKNFHAVKTPPPEVKNFYNDGGGDASFKGKPYRYDTGHTTHIWWNIE